MLRKRIRLQNVGFVEGRPVSELKKGNTIHYNFGYTGQVVGFGEETKKFRTVIIKQNGKIFRSRKKKDSFIVYD